MTVLILGLALFLGIHLTTALPRKRHKLVRQLGEKKYKLVFSIFAIVGLVLIIIGYAMADLQPWCYTNLRLNYVTLLCC